MHTYSSTVLELVIILEIKSMKHKLMVAPSKFFGAHHSKETWSKMSIQIVIMDQIKGPLTPLACLW